jgi:ABC-2 type transport system permease protein/oleandomycin transport system permease protein
VRRLLSDTLVVTERNLIRLTRAPEMLVAFTVQPIMFILLFGFVFGGAIRVPGSSYIEYLIPGIVVQTIAFGGFVTAIGLNDDMQKGLIDRFRSLPMARAAVLAGRTSADVVTSALSMTVLILTGLIIGFSFHTSPGHVIIGLVLALTFGYALLWACAFLGLLVKTPEAANAIGFIVVFPVTFISSAFVPVQTLPTPLRQVAEVNPFTIVVNELRWLWTGLPSPDHLWQAFAWVGFILIVFSPLAVQRYRRAASR